MSEGQLYAYEQFWDAVVNERVLIRGGYKMGMAQGEAIGIEKTNRKNALNFKKLGVDIETISKATGLTIEEIESL